MTTMMRYVISLLLTLTFCTSLPVSAESIGKDRNATTEKHQHEGHILPVSPSDESPLAILRSGHDGYRIAGSRSFRVLPSHAPGNSRSGGKVSSGAKSNLQKPNLRHATTEALCVKSYRALASCRCYFIALRHIIR